MKLNFFQKFSFNFNFFAFIISKRMYCQRHSLYVLSKICCLFFWGCVKNILTGSRLRSRQPKQRNIFFNHFTSLNRISTFFVFLTKSHFFHIYLSIQLSIYLFFCYLDLSLLEACMMTGPERIRLKAVIASLWLRPCRDWPFTDRISSPEPRKYCYLYFEFKGTVKNYKIIYILFLQGYWT